MSFCNLWKTSGLNANVTERYFRPLFIKFDTVQNNIYSQLSKLLGSFDFTLINISKLVVVYICPMKNITYVCNAKRFGIGVLFLLPLLFVSTLGKTETYCLCILLSFLV